MDKELEKMLKGENKKNQEIIKKHWGRLNSPWFNDYIRCSKSSRKYWNFISEKFPKKIQIRIKRLKEAKNKIARTINAQEIHNQTDEYKEKRERIQHYEIQIKECQKILDAIRQGASELVGNNNSPYPDINKILEVE